MSDTHILCFETSSTVCSVSIAKNSKEIYLLEEDNGFTHAEHLHLFIRQALGECGIKADQLSAIAVGSGPGSYTGLRIGMSAAKGLCFALNKPLILIPTLKLLAAAAKEKLSDAKFYIPFIDARRMEVYAAVYDNGLNEIEPTKAVVLDEKEAIHFNQYSGAVIFGSGMEKSKDLLGTNNSILFLDGIKPSAKFMIASAYEKYERGEFDDLAYSEPTYAKEFYDTRKNQKE